MSIIGSIEETAANAVVPGSGALLHIWLWLRKHWQTVVVALAVFALGLIIWRAPWAESRGFHSRDDEVVRLHKQFDDLQAADAKAQAAAVQHALDVEHAQDQAKDDQHAEDQDVQARANADLARRIAQLRSQGAATQRDGQQPATGEGGGSTVGADGPGGVPLLDAGDLQTCTDNTVKALGWQSFWSKVKAIPR